MPSKHYIGFILLTLIFILSLPQIIHAASSYDLQNKIGDHYLKAEAYIKKGQWSLCEKEYDQVLHYRHKLKRKCRGLIKSCSIRYKESFYKGFAPLYVSRGICRAGQKDYNGARNDANTALRWDNDYFKAHALLTMIAYLENNIPEARKHHKIVLKLNPKIGTSMLKTMPKLR